MGLSIEQRFDPTVGTSGTYAGMAQGYGPSSFEWSGFNPTEGTINQPGYMPDIFSQGTQGNYALGFNPSVNTGNQFGAYGYNPGPWGSINQWDPSASSAPYYGPTNTGGWESFNAGWPTNPFSAASGNLPYNVDNLVQPSNPPAFGGMFGPMGGSFGRPGEIGGGAEGAGRD